MNRTATGSLLLCSILAGTAALAAPRPLAPRRAPARQPSPAAPKGVQPALMTAEEARLAVTMLDDAYQAILHSVHETYPTKPGRPVAATIVRDLQKRMAEKGWPRSHFLSVSGVLMNPDHRAQTAFEQEAVRTLRLSAQRRVERLEDGRLQIATDFALHGDCFSCHWSDPGTPSQAAISWTIPVRKDGRR